MAIAFHGSTSNNVNAASSIAWTPPASSSGKFALVFLVAADADTVTTPSGWTRLDYDTDANMRWGVYYRTLASSSAVTFSGTAANKKVILGYVYDGVDSTTPINTGEMPAPAVYSSSSTTRAIPSGTCADDRMVVTFIGTRGSTPPSSFTAPGGWTEGADAYNTSSGATTAAGAYRAYTAGSFGGGNWTANVAESRAVVYSVPLNPAVSSVSGTAAVVSTAFLTATARLVVAGTAAVVTAASGAVTARLAATGAAPATSGAFGAVSVGAAVSGSAPISSDASLTVGLGASVTGLAPIVSTAFGAVQGEVPEFPARMTLHGASPVFTLAPAPYRRTLVGDTPELTLKGTS